MPSPDFKHMMLDPETMECIDKITEVEGTRSRPATIRMLVREYKKQNPKGLSPHQSPNLAKHSARAATAI